MSDDESAASVYSDDEEETGPDERVLFAAAVPRKASRVRLAAASVSGAQETVEEHVSSAQETVVDTGRKVKAVSAQVNKDLRAPPELRGSTAPAPGAPWGFKKNGQPRLRAARPMSEEEKQMLRERLTNPEVVAKKVAARKALHEANRERKRQQLKSDVPLEPPPPKTRILKQTVVKHVGLEKTEVEQMLEEALVKFERNRESKKAQRKLAEAQAAAAKEAEEKAQREAEMSEADRRREERRKKLAPAIKRTGSGRRAKFAPDVI